MSTARQARVILTGRYLRELCRQPAVIFITLTQPVIWLLLFGELFKNITRIPGFGAGDYATYLTPGVVIMTAMFSASWTGMAYIEDMQTGVMDRFLTAPVGRGALIAAMLAYQAVIAVVQSAIIIAMGWGIGAAFPGGAAAPAARFARRRAHRGYRRWLPAASPSRSAGCPWSRTRCASGAKRGRGSSGQPRRQSWRGPSR